MEKLDNGLDYLGNFNQDMKTIRRNQNGNDRDEKHKNKDQECFIWTDQQTGYSHGNKSVILKMCQQKLPKLKQKSSKCRGKKSQASKNCRIISNYLYSLLECQKEKREKWVEEIFEEITVGNVQKLNQTTDSRSSENTKQDKY